MPVVAKDLKLTPIARERETVGKRRPDLDDNCPECLARGRDTMLFTYDLTLGSGKSDRVRWCSFQQKEII